MNDIDLHYSTLTETADALKAREISPLELTRLMLDRITRLEPTLHAYGTVTADLAMEQAAQAEREITQGRYRGPLHGVPVAVKDICNTKGIVTAAGMRIRADYVPDFDATVVKRLRDAGAVLLGKLQLTEGAFAKHHPKITSRQSMELNVLLGSIVKWSGCRDRCRVMLWFAG